MGNKIGKYIIKPGPIGRGLYSYVYKAVDEQQNLYAVKVLRDLKIARHEASIMESYGMNSYLPLFYDFCITDNTAYLVMEYCQGGNLGIDNFNRSREKVGREEAIKIVIEVLRGIAHLHKKGILHNDIRPKNILHSGNKIKIVNFGLSVRLEQVKPNRKCLNNDLYDTGYLCIFLINGYVSEDPFNDLKLIDKNLRSIIFKAIHPERSEQFASPDEFINALELVLNN